MIAVTSKYTRENFLEFIKDHPDGELAGIVFYDDKTHKTVLTLPFNGLDCRMFTEHGNLALMIPSYCLRYKIKTDLEPSAKAMKASINKIGEVLGDTPEVLHLRKEFSYLIEALRTYQLNEEESNFKIDD